MRKKIATPVLLLMFALAAMASTPQKQATPSMLVHTDWLAAHLKDRNLVILHVGNNRAAYDQQHIPGARFLNLSEIAVMRNGIPNELPPLQELKSIFERLGVGNNSQVVLYGDMAGLHAARAYFTLDYLGHRNSSILDGGLEQWRAEGRPVSNTVPPSTRATLTVTAHPELIADLATVKQIVSEKRAALLDARPAKDYAGSAFSARSGHIPGAKNVYWGENIVSPQMPRLKPVSDIRARYEAAGLKPGSKVVVYCQTGIQAAHDYFTLKLAGFRPVLYDGSFIEWSNTPGTTVER